MKPLLLLFLLAFLTLATNAQIAPGNWDVHLSMDKTFKVVDGGEKIYFLSQGGIFSYNKSDNSVEQLTKLNGLSEANFETMAYNPTAKALVIAYKSSCIDIVEEDGSIIPINDIKRKYIPGDKAIHNIYNKGNLCYLSCGFGIVVLDAEKHEIKDTYRIGDNGANLQVYDLLIAQNQIYALTPNGIKYAPIDGINLLDYSNWSVLDEATFPEFEFSKLEYANGKLYTVTVGPGWWDDKTFERNTNGNWKQINGHIGIIYDFQASDQYFIYTTHKGAQIISTQNGRCNSV